MEKRADFEIFFIDFHRKGNDIHVRSVVSNIGNLEGECTVNCYVKNTATDREVIAVSEASGMLDIGKSCTVSLKFADEDIAERTENYVLLKAGEYILSLGENKENAVEVYSFDVSEDTYI